MNNLHFPPSSLDHQKFAKEKLYKSNNKLFVIQIDIKKNKNVIFTNLGIQSFV